MYSAQGSRSRIFVATQDFDPDMLLVLWRVFGMYLGKEVLGIVDNMSRSVQAKKHLSM